MSVSLMAQINDEEKETTRHQARSMVATKFGIVATSQTLASAAGARILEAGGNAVDAAIAANAVLGLVEPTSNGIGGDLFAVVYEAKSGKLYGLNSSGWAPSGLTIEFLQSKGKQSMPAAGIYTVTVPGAVAGWDALQHRFGTMPLSKVLQPAIYYASNGFPVTEIIAESWKNSLAKLSEYEDSKRTYLPDGKPPEVGQIFRNRDLAASLQAIAATGRDAFYKGKIADAILRVSKELDGTFQASDLAEFKSEWVEPISTNYRGWTVSELPPNGMGVAALSMLNLMERFPMSEYGHNSAKALHVLIEAKKLAYADMLRYVGDPRMASVPVQEMLSKQLAEERAKLIRQDQAACSVVASELKQIASKPGADTIYMSAIDREGNIVSLIQSNYQGFGSGVVPRGAGFMLHNRGALFTMEPGQPNSLSPRKRPLHTIIPAFMSKGDIRIGFGIMGGWNQAQAHAQFVSNVVDHGMNIQGAMEAARFTKKTFEGCDVSLEARVSESTQEELRALGHVITAVSPYSGLNMGGGQAVMSNGGRVHFGASDPRKDGAAVPENPDFFAVRKR
ncbi:MAG TPA: gamma-glutamyltransferase [Bryobacteraceae bacterium]|nr:gamma-glutamyltransferase [Bryobacteraceae bacterium]